jgi:hypothetical protein
MAALPKIVEEIVSGVSVVFEFSHCMWVLLMVVVVCFKAFVYREQLCINAVNYPFNYPFCRAGHSETRENLPEHATIGGKKLRH